MIKSTYKNHKLTLAALLFFIVFSVFKFNVSDWRFCDDNYGAAYFGKINSWSKMKDFFTSKHNDASVEPSNITLKKNSPQTTNTFRPLTLIWYAITLKFLDPVNNQNGFFNLSITLHAILVVLLFFIFSWFLTNTYAFFGAALFGLYPFLGLNFLGNWVMQPYTMGMIFNGLALISWRKWLESKQEIFATTSTLLYAATTLMNEMHLSFLFLFVFYTIYHRNKKLSLQETLTSTLTCWPFFGALGLYAATKLTLSTNNQTPIIVDWFEKLKYRFFNLISWLIDSIGLSWIPSGQGLWKIKTLLTTYIFLLTGMIFLLSKEKPLMTGLFTLFLIQSWPSLLITHIPRYIYLALPYLILAIFVGNQSMAKASKLKKITQTCGAATCLGLIMIGMYTIPTDLKTTEQNHLISDQAIRNFVSQNQNLSDYNLCMVGIPFDLFPVSGLAQAIWLYQGHDKNEIYCDPLNFIKVEEPDSLMGGEQLAQVSSSSNGFYISCPNTASYIETKNAYGKPIEYTMGKINIGISNGNNKAYLAHCQLDQTFLKKNPKLISWNFEKLNFFKI